MPSGRGLWFTRQPSCSCWCGELVVHGRYLTRRQSIEWACFWTIVLVFLAGGPAVIWVIEELWTRHVQLRTTPYFSRKNPATVNKGNIPTAVVLIRWRKYNRQQSQDKFPSLTNKDELNYRTSFEFSFKMDRNKIILAKPILVHLSTVPHGYVHRSTSGGVQAPARLASDHQCVSVRRFSSNSFSNFAF